MLAELDRARALHHAQKLRSEGGQFTGNFCARELKKQFYVTVVDAKDPVAEDTPAGIALSVLQRAVELTGHDFVSEDSSSFRESSLNSCLRI